MPKLRSTRPPKRSVHARSASGILLSMSLLIAAIALAGCVGTTSPAPAKINSAPNPGTLQIMTTSFAAGSVGTNYSGTLAANGGVAPYTWTTTGGALPAGLQLNGLLGAISGTPTVAGNSSFTVEVQDAHASVCSAILSLNVGPALSPTISGVVPSSGPTSGGTTVIISGSNFRSGAEVQFGASLATAVQIANATQIRAVVPPESKGGVAVTVKNSDGEMATDANAFTFDVPPVQVVTSALPVGAVGASYSAVLSATGGTPPYAWSTSGVLPKGLQLNATTGTIAGTPGLSGSFALSVSVKDSSTTSSATVSLNISADPSPTISGVAPSVGSMEGGTSVLITGGNFRPGVVVKFGSATASAVQIVNPNTVQAITPAESAGAVNVTLQNSDGQVAKATSTFTFAPQPAPAADVTVDVSQTVSETGGNDITAAKNIYASASAPESNGGLTVDWSLISSQLAMKRMRNINGLGDCALDGNGKLIGCSRLNSDLAIMKQMNLTPHVVVGQWAPASIGGNPLAWSSSQWAQYDALCYAVVNYVANQYGGTGFSEALFEVENEMDTITDPASLWLTTTPKVPQGDPSRFTQFDTVYRHWAGAVDLVAKQTPSKKIRIAGPATGFWTVYYGSGQLWHNQIISKYAAEHIRLDVVSLHIYDSEANDLAKYAQSIRSALIASGNPNAEIWVTEWAPSDLGDKYFGAINGSSVGAAWTVDFLLQALKGTVTGGSFLEVRDNQGADIMGVSSNMFEGSWNHVVGGKEYPKAVANVFSMVNRMTGTRKLVTTNPAKSNLLALSSSDSTSASLIVTNYDYDFDYTHKKYLDMSATETATVAFKNLPFSGSVVVDRYLIDAQTSNLDYWVAAGKLPPTLEAAQLQKVESFSAVASGGTLTLPARQLGSSAVTLWVVHQ
jgi:hypothetical protein